MFYIYIIYICLPHVDYLMNYGLKGLRLARCLNNVIYIFEMSAGDYVLNFFSACRRNGDISGISFYSSTNSNLRVRIVEFRFLSKAMTIRTVIPDTLHHRIRTSRFDWE